MSSLSREQYSWLHSLDLSFAVNSAKLRDFSNGFLVAEILSRYYPSEIHMHSYANGTGSDKRKQNWILLKKFFKKYNYPVSDADITNILYTKESSIQSLIDLLFTSLTNKSVQRAHVPEDPTALLKVPSYALPTASVAISQSFMEPQLRDQQDRDTLAASAAQAVADTKSLHEQQQVLRHVYRDEPLPSHVLGGVARMARTSNTSRAHTAATTQRPLVSSRSTRSVPDALSRTQPSVPRDLGLPTHEEVGQTVPSIPSQPPLQPPAKALPQSLSVTMPQSQPASSQTASSQTGAAAAATTPPAAATPISRAAPKHGYTLRGEVAAVSSTQHAQPPLSVEAVQVTVVKGRRAPTPVSSRDFVAQQI